MSPLAIAVLGIKGGWGQKEGGEEPRPNPRPAPRAATGERGGGKEPEKKIRARFFAVGTGEEGKEKRREGKLDPVLAMVPLIRTMGGGRISCPVLKLVVSYLQLGRKRKEKKEKGK